jgi:hypothetical protein
LITIHQEVISYLVLLDTLITIHQEVMGYLVKLDTLITIHQEVTGYLVLLDTLITIHQAVSITAGSQVTSLSYRGLVTIQNGRHNRERN